MGGDLQTFSYQYTSLFTQNQYIKKVTASN